MHFIVCMPMLYFHYCKCHDFDSEECAPIAAMIPVLASTSEVVAIFGLSLVDFFADSFSFFVCLVFETFFVVGCEVPSAGCLFLLRVTTIAHSTARQRMTCRRWSGSNGLCRLFSRNVCHSFDARADCPDRVSQNVNLFSFATNCKKYSASCHD